MFKKSQIAQELNSCSLQSVKFICQSVEILASNLVIYEPEYVLNSDGLAPRF